MMKDKIIDLVSICFFYCLYFKSFFNIKHIKDGINANNEVNRCVLGFLVVKNEIDLLPMTLEHYRKIGVTSFIIVDNMSSDGTFEYLSLQPDVTLYTINEKYKSSSNEWLSSKRRWLMIMLNRYGVGKWCIGFDADEIFVYRDFENSSIDRLIDYMEDKSFNALKCLWIDMYSDSKINETKIEKSTLIDNCPYFDSTCRTDSAVNRVFGWRSELDKTPLFLYKKNILIDNGWHRLRGDVRYCDFKGAVLHFPFTESFFLKTKINVESGAYYKNSAKYKKFYEKYKNCPDMKIYDPNVSVKFDSSKNLFDNYF